jgi:hypothetical protein
MSDLWIDSGVPAYNITPDLQLQSPNFQYSPLIGQVGDITILTVRRVQTDTMREVRKAEKELEPNVKRIKNRPWDELFSILGINADQLTSEIIDFPVKAFIAPSSGINVNLRAGGKAYPTTAYIPSHILRNTQQAQAIVNQGLRVEDKASEETPSALVIQQSFLSKVRANKVFKGLVSSDQTLFTPHFMGSVFGHHLIGWTRAFLGRIFDSNEKPTDRVLAVLEKGNIPASFQKVVGVVAAHTLAQQRAGRPLDYAASAHLSIDDPNFYAVLLRTKVMSPDKK